MSRNYTVKGNSFRRRGAPLPRCVECDMNFSSLVQWQEHRRKIHGIAASHLCSICSFASTDIQLLNHHLLKSHNIVHPRCVQCDLSFDSVRSWRAHCDQEHQGQKTFSCQKCDFSTLELNRYKEHIYSAHTIFAKNDSQLTCRVCERKFDSSNEYDEHNAKGHEYKCVDCKFTAQSERELSQHRLTNLCDTYVSRDTCGLRFKGMANLDKHLGTHGKERGLEEGPEEILITPPRLDHRDIRGGSPVGQSPGVVKVDAYNNGILQGLLSNGKTTFLDSTSSSSGAARSGNSTNVVGEATPLVPDLNRSDSLTPDPLPRCRVCDLTFPGVKSWRKHVKEEHPDDAYNCCICNYSAPKKSQLEKHLTLDHTLVEFPNMVLLPHCRDCSRSFANHGLWKDHRAAVHIDDETFNRERGEVASSQSDPMGNYARVQRVYPGPRTVTPNILSKSISCELCPFKTNAKIKMTNHYLQTHPDSNINAGPRESSTSTIKTPLPDPRYDPSTINYTNQLNPSKKFKYASSMASTSAESNSYGPDMTFGTPKIVHVTSLDAKAFEEGSSGNDGIRPVNLTEIQSPDSEEYESILPDLDYGQDDSSNDQSTSETKHAHLLSTIKSEIDVSVVKRERVENIVIESPSPSHSATDITSPLDHKPIKSEPPDD